MILLQFIDPGSGQHRLGVKTDAGVLDVAQAARATGAEAVLPATLDALLDGGPAAHTALAKLVEASLSDAAQPWVLDEARLQLAPCLSRPGKILCVGLNYRRHATETGMAIPTTPVLFSKFGNSLAGHGEPIPLPTAAREYDYEVELGVVIGRRAHHVAAADALDCVFGYCTANDFSARDLQMRTSQWLLGKTLDKFLPLGPYLVTADAVDDPQALRLRTWVNDDLRQDSTTADMIFPVAELISYISRYLPLEPGDLICTGTPEGVILGRAEKDWLRPGDVVTVEVEKLGRLSNVLVAEKR